MKSKALIWAPLLLVLGALMGWAGHKAYQHFFYSAPSLMDKVADPDNISLPSLILPDLNGKETGLADFKGKVLVVNLWASWCPPCRKETPEFIALQQELGSKGVQFVGIGVDEEPAIRAFVKEMGVTYPILLAGEQGDQILMAFGDVQGVLPYTLVLDREGKVRERHLGYYPQEELRRVLMSLI
ncbi:MAG: TlpA family protein disulfide reductase [Pseudomonadota bacterium]|uniref:TlpA family protein disulfide reductase n=1 Tax=Thermithiobacillus tepidarius TaxID=929 RepID=UPI000426EF31|nr:TlpA disulfide reductase family protein [Thermithiobacillus tepidarius]